MSPKKRASNRSSHSNLDELETDFLPPRIKSEIGKIQATLHELSEYEKLKSKARTFYINLTKKGLTVEINLQISLKRLLAIIGASGIGGTIYAWLEYFR